MIGRMKFPLALLTAVYCNPAQGQAPAATLKVELQNVVEYQVDADLSKFGTNPNISRGGINSSGAAPCLSVPIVAFGDIVAVNGRPAKGTYTSLARAGNRANQSVGVCLDREKKL